MLQRLVVTLLLTLCKNNLYNYITHVIRYMRIVHTYVLSNVSGDVVALVNILIRLVLISILTILSIKC